MALREENLDDAYLKLRLPQRNESENSSSLQCKNIFKSGHSEYQAKRFQRWHKWVDESDLAPIKRRQDAKPSCPTYYFSTSLPRHMKVSTAVSKHQISCKASASSRTSHRILFYCGKQSMEPPSHPLRDEPTVINPVKSQLKRQCAKKREHQTGRFTGPSAAPHPQPLSLARHKGRGETFD